MKRNITQKEILEVTLDAEGRALGRVASEAAKALLGKTRASFVKNSVAPVRVSIVNASKMKISETKLNTKEYLRYSGYPGGLTREKAVKLSVRKGYGELLKNAIHGMLPGNKLRPQIMKNLKVSE